MQGNIGSMQVQPQLVVQQPPPQFVQTLPNTMYQQQVIVPQNQQVDILSTQSPLGSQHGQSNNGVKSRWLERKEINDERRNRAIDDDYLMRNRREDEGDFRKKRGDKIVNHSPKNFKRDNNNLSHLIK